MLSSCVLLCLLWLGFWCPVVPGVAAITRPSTSTVYRYYRYTLCRWSGSLMFGAQCPDCAVWLHCSAVSVLVSRTCFIAYSSSSTAAAGPGCAVQCPHLALETSPHSVRQWVYSTEGSSDVTGAVPVTLSRSVTPCHAVRDWGLVALGVSGWAAAGGEIWVMQNIRDVREYEYRVTPNRQQRPERR